MYWPYSPLTHLASYISPLIDYFCLFNEKSLTENGTYAGKIVDIIKNNLPQPGLYDFFLCVFYHSRLCNAKDNRRLSILNGFNRSIQLSPSQWS